MYQVGEEEINYFSVDGCSVDISTMKYRSNNFKFMLVVKFFFDKSNVCLRLKNVCENAIQVAEIANGVYGADTVTANYVLFWFRRFRSGIFDVKDAPRTGRPVVENVDKITEIIEIDRHELLPHGQTLNSDLYCQQLDRLKVAIDQKLPESANRRCVEFHQDNVRQHTSVVIRQNFWDLSWEVLMHPPYNPDLAPSEYHLFLALKNFLSYMKLGSGEDCENRILDIFSNKEAQRRENRKGGSYQAIYTLKAIDLDLCSTKEIASTSPEERLLETSDAMSVECSAVTCRKIEQLKKGVWNIV
ncbi:histonelysine Nmethyltransferase SETMARlike [Trichonephila clavipes]|nr:histonelysine Nmethyltransferase SETMARlike [Trichonephila clavipes]